MFLFLVCLVAFAGEAPLRLTLEDAMEQAVANNPSITTAELSQRAARIDAHRARLDRFTAIVTSQAGYDLGGAADADATTTDQALTYQAITTIGTPLYTGGRVVASIAIADQNARIATIDHETAIRDLERLVVRAYWTIQGLELRLAATREGLRITEQALTIIQGRNAAGLTATLDVNRATVDLLSQRSQLVAEESEVYGARQDLLELLHMEGGEIVLVDNLENVPAPEWPGTPDTLIAQALARRPEMERFSALHTEAEASRRLARSGALPSISLAAEGGLESAAMASSGSDGRIAAEDVAPVLGGTVGANVAWNPFDLFRVRDAVQSANLEIAQVDASTESQRARIRTEVTSSLERVHALRARSEIVRQQLALARDNLQIIQDLYAQGSSSILELFDAQTAYRQATTAAAAQQLDLVSAEYELRWVLGERFTEATP